MLTTMPMTFIQAETDYRRERLHHLWGASPASLWRHGRRRARPARRRPGRLALAR